MHDLESYRDMMAKCSHCGLCQATCPVYLEDILQTHLARARMDLIRAVLLEDELPVTKRFREVLDRCLPRPSSTRAEGDADPLACSGEAPFPSPGTLPNWVTLN